MKKNVAILIGMLFATLTTAAQAASESPSLTGSLRIIATSDLHGFLTDYDYFQNKPTDAYGWNRLVAVIQSLQKESANSILLDNGDLVQGSPITDWAYELYSQKKLPSNPVIEMANLLGVEAMNLGNHEFNYGLGFIQDIKKQATFPIINSNVMLATDKGFTAQLANDYLLIDRDLILTDRSKKTIRIGITGFTPPQIMLWDSKHLKNRVNTLDGVEETQKRVSRMKMLKADIIVVLAHSGLGQEKIAGKKAVLEMSEDRVMEIADIKGVDAIVFGHSHAYFPAEKPQEQLNTVDNKLGLIKGVAAVNPGSWGSAVGVVDLQLKFENKSWNVVGKLGRLALPVKDDKKATRPNEISKTNIEKLDQLLAYTHDQVKKHFDKAIGETKQPINTYFSIVEDSIALEVVNKAQIEYIKPYIELSAYKQLPILSASAPFKAGDRDKPMEYSEIGVGELKLKNAADLYKYPNTLAVVKITGEQVIEWLERSATIFNQIDTKKTDTQQLINKAFPTFNFDVIDGVEYTIEVDKPARYDLEGKLINNEAHRISNVTFQGKPIDLKQEFLVVTNNYRANGGGAFPALNGKSVVIQLQDTNREALVDYIRKNKLEQAADKNWTLVIPKTTGTVEYASSPNAKEFAPAWLEATTVNDIGFLVFKVRK